ncbi:hypothetical protein GKE82_25535 [Conexibacter sp. W3-3-2]|uniref:hypothetical protein n=1 Tax=Conexibacter sp. W3-3-2 TaxID=2675227 RepID=UPI0012B6C0A1|nr:hypothetical protein [Conexibacter sp. W3-3-2]MTD47432.1 hypothetical protein [Conexibacter sp. W3-3-2]MTD47571.1 hypothetical protein [Conexibacter sp. W3-3-2]
MDQAVIALKPALVNALTGCELERSQELLGTVEEAVSVALSSGDVSHLVSVRGQTSRLRRAASAAAPEWDGLAQMVTYDRLLAAAITGLQLALRREQGAAVPEDVRRAARSAAPKLTIREQVLKALDDKPRRPLEIMQRTGVGKRQTQRALGELVKSGQARPVIAASADDRSAFYQRVA